jgi:WD40 repeat protein
LAEEYPENGQDEEDESEARDDEAPGPILKKKPVFASADFAPNGKTLLTAGWDGVLSEWDAETGGRLSTLLEPGPPQDANPPAGLPRQDEAAGQAIRVIRLSEYQRGWSLPTVRFSKDGRLFAVGALNGWVVVWNAHSRGELSHFPPHGWGVSALDFSPDGRYLATGSREWGGDTLRLWRVPKSPEEGFQEIFRSKKHPGGVRNVRFSPDGRHLAASGVPLSTYMAPLIFRTRTGSLRSQLEWDVSWAVEFSPKGRLLATGNDFGEIRIWRWKRNRRELEIAAHKEIVRSLDWSPNGRNMASGSNDGAVKVWDIRDGRLVREFALAGNIVACRFFEDGRILRAAAAAEEAIAPEIRRWTM